MRRLDRLAPEPISIDFEGTPVRATEGEPIACALLESGETVFSRSVKYHRPRGPFCFAAACSHCLMRVDGVPNVFTCKTPARPGLRIERQNAYPSVELDVFAATDWLFPHGLDHHEMFAGVPIAQPVMQKVARHLAGLGLLPDEPAPPRASAEVLRPRVAIVGSGPAGLAAATELRARNVPFLLRERERHVGGRLATGALAGNEPIFPELPPELVRTNTAVIGLYDDSQGRFLAAVSGAPESPRLLKVYPERFLFATGGHPQLVPFANNDLPGIYAARAASLLLRRHRLLVGDDVVCVGEGPELYHVASLLEESGARIAAIVDSGAPRGRALGGSPLKAHGRKRVKGLTVQLASGTTQRFDCDAVVVCRPPSPSFELARQGGALVVFDPVFSLFVVQVDERGRTRNGAIYAAGEVTGPMTAVEAAAAGRVVGQAIADELLGAAA